MRGPLLRGTPFMAAFALVLLLSSCSGSGHAAATPGATSETTRSIQPSLSTANPSAQTECPRATGERVVNPQFGPAIGEGPVYAVVPRNEPNVVAFTVTTPGRGPFYPGVLCHQDLVGGGTIIPRRSNNPWGSSRRPGRR